MEIKKVTVSSYSLCTEEMLTNRKDSDKFMDASGKIIEPDDHDGPVYKLTPVAPKIKQG